MYHGANGMRPDLVPVGGDGGAGLDGSGELEGTRGTVIIARDGRVRRVLDRVAAHIQSAPHATTSIRRYVLARPGALNGGLAGGRVVGGPSLVPGPVDRVGKDTTVGASQRERGKNERGEADHFFCLLGRVV